MKIGLVPLIIAAAAACGGCDGSRQEGGGTAEQLREAAAQSDPAAAPVLENAANSMEGQQLPLATPGSPPQDALEQAGQAQASAANGTSAGSNPQTLPHGPGDPVPPPRIRP